MSADNMICVQLRRGKWWVWMDYASNKKLKPKHDRDRQKFRSGEVAMIHAIVLRESLAVVEYGIRLLDPKP